MPQSAEAGNLATDYMPQVPRVFPGGVGKTNTPEQFDTLYGGVVTRIFDPLPDETWVYPGHGDDTTVGTERPQLAEWLERGW